MRSEVNAVELKLPLSKEQIRSLHAGDVVTLTGTIYTARDAAHKKLCAMLAAGEALPFPLEGAFLYYCGPCPAPPGAVIGSCGLAIGLALQGSLANIAGGFVLVIAKPFAIGDFIISGDISGTVEEIGVFHTKVITIDNKRIIVPNSAISNATLINATAMKRRRVDLTFNASYGDDIDTVERVLKETCRAHALILDDPEPFARLSGHKDSALEYTVRAWCKTEDYWTVYFDLIRDVKVAFDKNGVTVPFPQVDVHAK